MNDEENKLSTVSPRYNAPLYNELRIQRTSGASRTSLRYNELKFVISEDTEL
ncbi:Hypothetical protein FKW44_020092, partial [Caligus rogercresseyi]